MEWLEAGPEWLKADIKRWRTPPRAVCAEHPSSHTRGRCGSSNPLRGCFLRPEIPTTVGVVDTDRRAGKKECHLAGSNHSEGALDAPTSS